MAKAILWSEDTGKPAVPPKRAPIRKQRGRWLRMYPMAPGASCWKPAPKGTGTSNADPFVLLPLRSGNGLPCGDSPAVCPGPGRKHGAGPSQRVPGTMLATKPCRRSLSNTCEYSRLDLEINTEVSQRLVLTSMIVMSVHQQSSMLCLIVEVNM